LSGAEKNFSLNKAVDKKRESIQLSTGQCFIANLFMLAKQMQSTLAHTFTDKASACHVKEKWHCPHRPATLIYYD